MTVAHHLPEREFPLRIGLDLDNTVIDYGPAYPLIAAEMGLSEGWDRASIREQLRRPDDDQGWRHFQSVLYTRGLDHAQPATGLLEFLADCRAGGIGVVIVSHKTPRSHEDDSGQDLHTPARRWLQRTLHAPGLIAVDDVHLCPTRSAKVATIGALDLPAFLDDLPEVLSDPGFPAGTLPLQYTHAVATGELTPDGWPGVGFPWLHRWLRRDRRPNR